jgi:hypothetical protein
MTAFPEVPKSEYYLGTREARQAFLRAAYESPEIPFASGLAAVSKHVVETPEQHYAQQFSAEAIAWRASLDETMNSWAASVHLDRIEWVVPMAWDAINTWQLLPDRRYSNPFTSRSVYKLPPDFQWPPWIYGTSEDDYRRDVEGAFTRTLEAYLSECRKRKSQEPIQTARRSRNDTHARYTWTALRVCGNWSFTQIAERVRSDQSITEEAIRKMVKAVRRRIGIPTL